MSSVLGRAMMQSLRAINESEKAAAVAAAAEAKPIKPRAKSNKPIPDEILADLLEYRSNSDGHGRVADWQEVANRAESVHNLRRAPCTFCALVNDYARKIGAPVPTINGQGRWRRLGRQHWTHYLDLRAKDPAEWSAAKISKHIALRHGLFFSVADIGRAFKTLGKPLMVTRKQYRPQDKVTEDVRRTLELCFEAGTPAKEVKAALREVHGLDIALQTVYFHRKRWLDRRRPS